MVKTGILVVDDETLNVFEKYLKLKGFDVFTANVHELPRSFAGTK